MCPMYLLFVYTYTVGGEVLYSLESTSNLPVLSNISCPEYTYAFYDCSFSNVSSSACINHQMDAVAQCYDGE